MKNYVLFILRDNEWFPAAWESHTSRRQAIKSFARLCPGLKSGQWKVELE